MKIGDEVMVHGFIDEIRNDVIIIRNNGGYFGTVGDEIYATLNADEGELELVSIYENGEWKRSESTDFCEFKGKMCETCLMKTDCQWK